MVRMTSLMAQLPAESWAATLRARKRLCVQTLLLRAKGLPLAIKCPRLLTVRPVAGSVGAIVKMPPPGAMLTAVVRAPPSKVNVLMV